MRPLGFFVVLLCSSLLVPVLGLAHGDEKSFEFEVGNYFVDIGYDQNFAVEKDTLLDFLIFETSSNTATSYSSIAISLQSGSTVQWNRVIEKPEFGKAITSVVPQESGHWDFHVVFHDDAKVIVDTSFPVYISELERDLYFIPITLIIFGVVGGYLFYRKKIS